MATEKAILLIEDDLYDAELTVAAFQVNGFKDRIMVFKNGETALDYLFGTGASQGRDIRDIPKLILLDLKLPRMDGLEVLKRIRSKKHTRYIPVIILTSSQEPDDRKRAYADGCNAYIHKPVDFEQFNHAIQILGLFWTNYNEPAYDFISAAS